MTIKVSCDTEPKAANRELIKNWVQKNFTPKRLKNARVLCLPGGECLEIYQIWDKLGVKRKNIYAVTNDPEQARQIRQGARGVNVILEDLYNTDAENRSVLSMSLLRHGLDFDVIYFDLYGNLRRKFTQAFINYPKMLKDNGVFGMTVSAYREKGEISLAVSMGGTRSRLLSVMMFHYITWPELLTIPGCVLTSPGDGFLWTALDKGGGVKVDSRFLGMQLPLFYPTDVLKTKYIGTNRAPMESVLFKCRKATHATKLKLPRILANKYEQSVSDGQKVYINCKVKDMLDIKHGIEKKGGKFSRRQLVEFVKMIRSKADEQTVCEWFGITYRQLSAYKAHVTMGTYD